MYTKRQKWNDQRVQETSPVEGARKKESYLIDLIDKADTIERYEKLINKLNEGTLDTPGFLKALAPQAALELVHIMTNGENEKTRLDAAKDLLDRAGHGKTQKVAVGHVHVDHTTSKRELINMVLSAARKAGINTVRKDDDEAPEVVEAAVVGDAVPDGLSEGGGDGASGEEVCRKDGDASQNDSDQGGGSL